MEFIETPDGQPLTTRVLKGSSIVLLFTFAVAPLGYLLRMMLSRSLSIEMYGLFYAMISFFSFFATYNDLGFGYSLSYFFPKYFRKKNYRTSWNLYVYDQNIELGTSLVLSLLLFFMAPWLTENYFKIPEAEYLIRIFCVYFIANSIASALYKLFIGMQKELYYASMEFVRFLFLIIFTFIFYLKNSHDVSVYAWGLASSFIFIAFCYRMLLQKNYAILTNQSVSWDRKLFLTMATYALPTIMTTSVYTLISFSDTFFLTLFKGVAEVGMYNVMIPVVAVLVIFLSPINSFLFPLISHHMESNRTKVHALLHHTLRVIPFIAFYFAIFIILFPNPIISILFGNKWSDAHAVAVSMLAIGYTVSSLTSFFTTFVIGLGKVRQRFNVAIIAALVNVIGSVLLIPLLGVTGAAYSLIITSIVSLLLLGKIINSELPFHYPILFYAKIGIIGSVLFITCRYFGLSPTNWFDLIAYGTVYTIVMVLFGLSVNVFPNIWQLLPKKMRVFKTQ